MADRGLLAGLNQAVLALVRVVMSRLGTGGAGLGPDAGVAFAGGLGLGNGNQPRTIHARPGARAGMGP